MYHFYPFHLHHWPSCRTIMFLHDEKMLGILSNIYCLFPWEKYRSPPLTISNALRNITWTFCDLMHLKADMAHRKLWLLLPSLRIDRFFWSSILFYSQWWFKKMLKILVFFHKAWAKSIENWRVILNPIVSEILKAAMKNCKGNYEKIMLSLFCVELTEE